MLGRLEGRWRSVGLVLRRRHYRWILGQLGLVAVRSTLIKQKQDFPSCISNDNVVTDLVCFPGTEHMTTRIRSQQTPPPSLLTE
ncbi:hypothetical protein ARMSODRAFT_967195 [Armillaria solidipes]|uniref:Uncharacterized protein n=1 Tax=Armillaria solidipes TaxID=1076256 RepID=A0A2H3AJJ5_9AGAR|nr:hypothetical protein ARMSODRAFT_967195 [Armillaria solidipes]